MFGLKAQSHLRIFFLHLLDFSCFLPQFDHWEVMTYDPLKDDSPANVIMLEVRRRKGLKAQPNVITGAS